MWVAVSLKYVSLVTERGLTSILPVVRKSDQRMVEWGPIS